MFLQKISYINLADGSSGYAGVVLNPGESAQLGSQPVAATSAKQLKFKYYDATEGIQFFPHRRQNLAILRL